MNFPFHFLSTLEATKRRLSRSRAGTRDSSWRHHRLGENDLVEISQSLERITHNSQAATPSLFLPDSHKRHNYREFWSSVNYTQDAHGQNDHLARQQPHPQTRNERKSIATMKNSQ